MSIVITCLLAVERNSDTILVESGGGDDFKAKLKWN